MSKLKLTAFAPGRTENGLCIGIAVGFLLSAVVSLIAGPALAHHGQKVVLYVAQDGSDTGGCRNAESPCRTLPFALGKAGKGDTIRVATGT